MVGTAGLGGKLQIPGNLAILAFGADAPVAVGGGVITIVDVPALEKRVVFTVGGDDFSQGFGLPHSPAHHLRGLNAPPVVGKGDDTGGHTRHIRQGFPLFPLGNGPVGIDMDAGGVPDAGALNFQGFRAVRHRV